MCSVSTFRSTFRFGGSEVDRFARGVPGCARLSFSLHLREWRNGRRASFRCWCPKGRGGSSPPSRTTQRAAARQNAAALQDAADHVETGVDLIDELDVVDGVENCLADHGAAAIALRGGLCTVDAMPATHSLSQTRQLDVTRRRLGRIGAIATQNTDTYSVSPLTLVPTAPVTSTPTFPLGAQTRRVDASGRFKPGFDAGTLSELLGWSAGGLDVTVVDGWLLLTQSSTSRQISGRRCSHLGALTVNANGVERVALRPAHLERAALGADRNLLIAPLSDIAALVVVNPAVCLFGAPGNVLAGLSSHERSDV